MKCRFHPTALILLLTASSFAQEPDLDPPIAGRPHDFSHIVGKYTIQAVAEPREVFVEEPITLTVRISGTGPASYEPRRKLLQIFPDWDADFYIENVPDQDRVSKADNLWMFVYRLRPKHTKVDAIDDIKLVYYDPAARKFQERYAPRIENVVVKTKHDPEERVVMPSPLPDSFYQLVETPFTISSNVGSPSIFSFVIALAMPPFLCLVGVALVRRIWPDETSQRTRLHNEAAQRALAALRAGRVFPAFVVQRYLRERLEFTVEDPTPGDVATFLNCRGIDKVRSRQAAAFFQACDAVRFANQNVDVELVAEATRVIESLEADPCVR